MKRKLTIICAALVLLPILLIGIQALRVSSALREQTHTIKEALRATPAGTIQSNVTNGVQRFIESGELVFELPYLRNPNLIKKLEILNMRVYPRVTTHRSDGWVGIYKGSWYVKIP
jgi:hypothetical protein